MPQSRRLRLVASKPQPRSAPLSQIKFNMLSCRSPMSKPTFESRLARLRQMDPDAADVIERLVDDLLKES